MRDGEAAVSGADVGVQCELGKGEGLPSVAQLASGVCVRVRVRRCRCRCKCGEGLPSVAQLASGVCVCA